MNVNPFDLILLPYQKQIFQDNHPFIVCMQSRQTGKSLTISAKAVYNSILNPQNLTLLVSVNQRSADELLLKAKQWALACKQAATGLLDYTDNATSITFSNGSRIISVPANPASLRGWTGDVILDEFALVQNDEEIYQAVLPVITSKMKGKQHSLIVCSTPSSLETIFAKIWHDQSGSWHKYELNIYDAVKQGLQADPDTLKKIINDDLVWQTEYMCEFASGASLAFETTNLEKYSSLPISTTNRYIGFDVGRKNDFSVIVVLANDKTKNLFYIDELVKMKNTPYHEQLDILKKICQKYHIVNGLVDQCGIGNMVAEEATRTVCPRIKGFTWNSGNKTELHDNLRTILSDGRLLSKNDIYDEIILDLKTVRRYISQTGKISYSAPHSADGHADICSAICLALKSVAQDKSAYFDPIINTTQSMFTYPKRMFR